MAIDITFSSQALKKLKKIPPKDHRKVQQKIDILITNPFSGKPLKGELCGKYSLRAWPLRIVYTYHPQNKLIYILRIDYRGSVY